MALNYDLISSVHCSDIDFKDYPDFCDAYIDSAEYDGREMAQEELDELNEDYDYVYQAVMNQIF